MQSLARAATPSISSLCGLVMSCALTLLQQAGLTNSMFLSHARGLPAACRLLATMQAGA